MRTYVHLLDKGLSDADFLDGVVSASSARAIRRTPACRANAQA